MSPGDLLRADFKLVLGQRLDLFNNLTELLRCRGCLQAGRFLQLQAYLYFFLGFSQLLIGKLADRPLKYSFAVASP